jgi:hypothetical protein
MHQRVDQLLPSAPLGDRNNRAGSRHIPHVLPAVVTTCGLKAVRNQSPARAIA